MKNKRPNVFIAFLFLASISISAGAESKIKNILLLISDDLKAGTLGCYGDPLVQTPHIDALAAQGMLFNRAYCQGMTCGPSRQSFMFSRYKGDHGTSLGQNFINNGIYSARVGKIFHMKVPGDIVEGSNGEDYAECWTERFNSPGLEAHTAGLYSLFNHNIFTYSLKDRASTAEKDRWFVSVEYEGDGSDQPDWKTATKTIDLLRKHKDKPFFIAAGFVRPHYPNVAPEQYFEQYPYRDVSLPEAVEGDLDDIPEMGYTDVRNGSDPIGLYPDNQKRMWAAYYATITYIDNQLGRIMAELDRLGLRESTAIVFMSDHGYLLGEHTFWQKNNLHEEVTRVPLIISAPGLKAGVSDAFVELVDMYPTVSDLVGIPVPETVQGKSLVPILKNPGASVREEAFSVGNNGTGFALRGDAWTYILYKNDTEELYDMKKDPKQFTNLVKDPKFSAVRELQRTKLLARIDATDLKR